MKKWILLFLGASILAVSAEAQYNINKTQYDHKNYTYNEADPYHPAVAGLVSFFTIPGLGHMIVGERKRGTAFLGGSLGSIAVLGAGGLLMLKSPYNFIMYSGSEEGKGMFMAGLGMALAGGGSSIAIRIWSTVDAVKVTMVNNLAYRDQQKSSMNLMISPYYAPSGTSITHTSTAGIKLALKF